MENGWTANPSKIHPIERFTQELTEDSTPGWGEGLYLVMLGFFPWSGFQGNHYHNFLTKNTSRKSQESNNLMTTRCDSEVSMTIIDKIFTFSQHRLSDLQLIPAKFIPLLTETWRAFRCLCSSVLHHLSDGGAALQVTPPTSGLYDITRSIALLPRPALTCCLSSRTLIFGGKTKKKRGKANTVEASVSRKSVSEWGRRAAFSRDAGAKTLLYGSVCHILDRFEHTMVSWNNAADESLSKENKALTSWVLKAHSWANTLPLQSSLSEFPLSSVTEKQRICKSRGLGTICFNLAAKIFAVARRTCACKFVTIDSSLPKAGSAKKILWSLRD